MDSGRCYQVGHVIINHNVLHPTTESEGTSVPLYCDYCYLETDKIISLEIPNSLTCRQMSSVGMQNNAFLYRCLKFWNTNSSVVYPRTRHSLGGRCCPPASIKISKQIVRSGKDSIYTDLRGHWFLTFELKRKMWILSGS